jgi:hypothetical protein
MGREVSSGSQPVISAWRGGEEIQNGDWDTDAGSVSSVNQRPCWDTGVTLGRDEAPGKDETLAPWAPSLWKASPRHYTLREQVGHHPHAAGSK